MNALSDLILHMRLTGAALAVHWCEWDLRRRQEALWRALDAHDRIMNEVRLRDVVPPPPPRQELPLYLIK